MAAYNLSSYIDTEKSYAFHFDTDYDCMNIINKDKDTTMSMFKTSINDPVSQIKNLKRHFEECSGIDSLVIDSSPMVDFKRYKKSSPNESKMFEYS